ncbi:MAG: hypothetical protein H6740_19225 [Alphaproteobacteria bacterium]|nr:hypothetical protein [Alphaproteobacteria bacterium]
MNVYSREEFAAVPRNAEDVELYIYRPYGEDEGGLTDADLGQLAPLTALRRLELGEAYGVSDAGLKAVAAAHPALERLSLRVAPEITGKGLGALGQLPIEDLTLWGAKRVGSLSGIAGLPLRRLEVRDCRRLGVGALASVADFRDLDEIEFVQQAVDQGVLAAVASLPKLRRLFIYSQELEPEALCGLAGAPALEELVVHRAISPAEANTLAQLPALRALKLRVKTAEGLSHLAPLEGQVEDVSVFFEDYPDVPESLLEELVATLPSLRGLHLGELGFTSRQSSFGERGFEIVSRLGELRRLALRRLGAFKNDVVAPIAALSKLESLNLNGMYKLTAGVFKTLAELSALRHLELGSVEATDGALKKLQKLPALETLCISKGKKVGDKGLLHLAGVPSLKRLQVYYYVDQIGDAGVKALAGMPQLEELWMDMGQVTDAAWEALGQAPALRRFALNSSRSTVSDAQLAAIGASQTLETFDIGVYPSLELSDAGLEGLIAAPALHSVDVRGGSWSPAALTRARDEGVYVTRRGNPWTFERHIDV